jgi:hypothetical protein
VRHLSPRWRKIGRIVISRVLFYGGIGFGAWWWMLEMPGSNLEGRLPPLTGGKAQLATQLHRDVDVLAVEIGDRNVPFHAEHLDAAAKFLEDSFGAAGHAVQVKSFLAGGSICRNIEVEIRGSTRPDEIVVVGAHYDSSDGSPGADDNASGVAVLLALARNFSSTSPYRTLRLVAFANEEPPWFWQPEMGSLVYAKESRLKHENVVAMLSLESVGYFTDAPRSQNYPAALGLLYPSTGNFVAFVGNLGSRSLVHRALRSFRGAQELPSIGAALPNAIPGVGWSDQWSFWQQGYPAIEITDTAPHRNPNYHAATDTPATLDYARMARFTTGMSKVIRDLTDSGGK